MTEELPSGDEPRETGISKESVGRIKAQKRTPDEIADAAQRSIDEAIKRNVPLEITIGVILVLMASIGFFLTIRGAADHQWELLASGSLFAVAVGWPVSRLFQMWQFNLALKTLPAIIRMSDNKNRQELLVRFVDQLIHRLRGP